jgi:hypothetical protein
MKDSSFKMTTGKPLKNILVFAEKKLWNIIDKKDKQKQ